MVDYISIDEAVKLVIPFPSEKREVLVFVVNVNTACKVTVPGQAGTLYKRVSKRISGVPRSKTTHRNLEYSKELEEFLQHTYAGNRMLGDHASHPVPSKQNQKLCQIECTS
jgi:hypothetical protein